MFSRRARTPIAYRPSGKNQRGVRPCLWCDKPRMSRSFEDRFCPPCRRLKDVAAEAYGDGAAIYHLGTLQEPPIIS